MSKSIWYRFSQLLCLAAVASGCSAEAGNAPEGQDSELLGEASSELITTTDWIYDGDNEFPTQCTVGGLTMHCCPSGRAIIGVHHAANVFKCARLNATNGTRSISREARNGMLSCPVGQVAVGFHGDQNALACQTVPGMTIGGEEMNGFADSFPMLTCRPNEGRVMTGLHLGRNVMTCAKDTTPVTPPNPPPTKGSLVASTVVQTVSTATTCGTVQFTIDAPGLNQTVGGTFGASSGFGLIDCNYRATWNNNLSPGAHTVCLTSQAITTCKSVPIVAGQLATAMF